MFFLVVYLLIRIQVNFPRDLDLLTFVRKSLLTYFIHLLQSRLNSVLSRFDVIFVWMVSRCDFV